MNRVKIKICGLTRDEDVESVIEAGVDAVGFVFTESPRRISIRTAIRLVNHVPENVLRIGLFLDQDRPEISRVVDSVSLDVLQFHGNETETECDVYGLPWLKAVAMENDESVKRAELEYPGALGLLLDSHTRGTRGGSGKVFDWSLTNRPVKPVWLAGGLNTENVAQAIRVVKPYAVDVSSGVESSPGIKDRSKVFAFVNAVKDVTNGVLKGNQ